MKKIRKKNNSYKFTAVIILILFVIIFGLYYKKNDCKIINNNHGEIFLVNKENPLNEDYCPKNLIVPDVPIYKGVRDEERQVEKSAAAPIKELFNAATKDGYSLFILSAYRSYSVQKNIFDNSKKINGIKYAEKYAAQAGQSEHQTGLAIDITNSEKYFPGSKEAKWLNDNAYKFGFIIRYPENKEDITGYSYEPWHIRYVGKKIAKEMYDKNLTLEEYLSKQ